MKVVPGLVWQELAGDTMLPPPARVIAKAERSRQPADEIIEGGLPGLTGKGVLIAILDSGIDFRHPDFISRDDKGRVKSKLRYFWDLSSDAYANGVGIPAPFQYPNGAPIGTIFDRATIEKEIRGESSAIAVWDINGHGTGCASVAAGNSDGGKKGVAPDAEIIAVRITDDENKGVAFSFMLGAICEWLDKTAGHEPLVISCSWGGQLGGHDGFNLVDRQLDARFADAKKGRAICIAAGNEGASPTHASIRLNRTRSHQSLKWSSPTGAVLQVYFDATDPKQLDVTERNMRGVKQASAYLHPLTKQIVIELVLLPGEGCMKVGTTSEETIADAYLLGSRAKFDDDSVTYEKLVGSPGSSTQAITVGSYDWNDEFNRQGKVVTLPDVVTHDPLTIGEVSTYSSPGPLRVGKEIKPDIVAPGQWFAAAAPQNAAVLRDSTGQYQPFNGTSAATPYTAGVVALLLQKKGTLTVGEIKQLLKQHATRDRHTGKDLPNSRWGHGKLDITAVKQILSDPLFTSK